MNRDQALQYIMDADESKNKGEAFKHIKTICVGLNSDVMPIILQTELDEILDA